MDESPKRAPDVIPGAGIPAGLVGGGASTQVLIRTAGIAAPLRPRLSSPNPP